jgi:hypothetical protein
MIIRTDWLAKLTAWRHNFHTYLELGYQKHDILPIGAALLTAITEQESPI